MGRETVALFVCQQHVCEDETSHEFTRYTGIPTRKTHVAIKIVRHLYEFEIEQNNLSPPCAIQKEVNFKGLCLISSNLESPPALIALCG